MIMENSFWLLTTLVETAEHSNVNHSLFKSLESAQEQRRKEIERCSEDFAIDTGKYFFDSPLSYVWRDQDGHGFEIYIELITPND